MTEINERPQNRPTLKQRFLSSSTYLSFIVLALLITVLITRFDVDWSQIKSGVQESNPAWFILALVIHYTTFIFRGIRWRLLMLNATRNDDEAPPVRSAIYCGFLILISWFANSITWFRLGDAYRAYAYTNDTGSSFPRTMGTVLADRILDIGIVIGLMALGSALMYLHSDVQPSPALLLGGIGLFALIVGILILFYHFRNKILSILPDRLATGYDRFHTGTFGSLNPPQFAILFGVLSWAAEVGRLICVVNALGVSLSFGLLLCVPLVNGLLTAIPLTPGGLAIVEPGVTGLLLLELIPEEAVAVVLVDRSISYVSVVITGGLGFLARQLLAAKKAITT